MVASQLYKWDISPSYTPTQNACYTLQGLGDQPRPRAARRDPT